MKSRPFRILYAVVFLILANHGKLCAQTNANAAAEQAANAAAETSRPAPTNTTVVLTPQPRAPTRIEAARGEFDMARRVVTYRGHVRVDDPEMKLTSEWLITDLPQAGEHVNHIVAETNVVIDFRDDKGQTNHATCAKAVYRYEVKDGMTNELVTLSGNSKVENVEFTMTGEPIVLNLATRKITADDEVVTFHQTFIKASAGTNSPPIAKPTGAAANSPPAQTHVPPGTNETIDKTLRPGPPP